MRFVDKVFWENLLSRLHIDPKAMKVSLLNYSADIEEYLRDGY